MNRRGTWLVTGASAGIGRTFAEQLAARGHDLVLVARDEARLQDLAASLRGQHAVSTEVLPADLSTTEGLERVRARCARGDLDGLVNNAGFGTRGSMTRASLESQAAMLHVHVMTPNALCHAVLPGMVERGRGTIINVSSVASFITSAGNVNYCASKAFLRVFSEALAQEMGPKGIVVQALCPGFTHTEFHARANVDKTRWPGWLWLDAARVVRESLEAADRRGPVVVIPGRRYRAIVFLLRHAPLRLRTRAAARHRRDT